MSAPSSKATRRWLAGLLIVLVAIFVSSGLVKETPTQDDREVLIESGIVDPSNIGKAGEMSLDRQREVLRRVLAVVHKKIGRFDPIPNMMSREPRIVLLTGSGVCFDRARVIEKAARLMGFEARRVFLLYGGWSNLFTAGSESHTLVEVKTRAGWVFLGTLSAISGFDSQGEPWSVADLAENGSDGGGALERNGWLEIVPMEFVPLYGIYSRTGFHYWPYTPMPDYSIRQILSSWQE